MAVSLSSDFKANLAQLPDVDGIESITLTFKDTGERCGGVRPASWRSCMCSRRRVQERIPESAHGRSLRRCDRKQAWQERLSEGVQLPAPAIPRFA